MICIPNFRHIHPAVGERNYQIIGSFSFVFDIVKGSFTVIQPCAALFEIAPQLKIFDIQSNLRTGRRQRQNRRAVCIFPDGKYAFGIIVEMSRHTQLPNILIVTISELRLFERLRYIIFLLADKQLLQFPETFASPDNCRSECFPNGSESIE